MAIQSGTKEHDKEKLSKIPSIPDWINWRFGKRFHNLIVNTPLIFKLWSPGADFDIRWVQDAVDSFVKPPKASKTGFKSSTTSTEVQTQVIRRIPSRKPFLTLIYPFLLRLGQFRGKSQLHFIISGVREWKHRTVGVSSLKDCEGGCSWLGSERMAVRIIKGTGPASG